jgi:hypothetical protein
MPGNYTQGGGGQSKSGTILAPKIYYLSDKQAIPDHHRSPKLPQLHSSRHHAIRLDSGNQTAF